MIGAQWRPHPWAFISWQGSTFWFSLYPETNLLPYLPCASLSLFWRHFCCAIQSASASAIFWARAFSKCPSMILLWVSWNYLYLLKEAKLGFQWPLRGILSQPVGSQEFPRPGWEAKCFPFGAVLPWARGKICAASPLRIHAGSKGRFGLGIWRSRGPFSEVQQLKWVEFFLKWPLASSLCWAGMETRTSERSFQEPTKVEVSQVRHASKSVIQIKVTPCTRLHKLPPIRLLLSHPESNPWAAFKSLQSLCSPWYDTTASHLWLLSLSFEFDVHVSLGARWYPGWVGTVQCPWILHSFFCAMQVMSIKKDSTPPDCP